MRFRHAAKLVDVGEHGLQRDITDGDAFALVWRKRLDRGERFFCILDLKLQRRPMVEGQRLNPGWRLYRRGKKRRLFIGKQRAGPPELQQTEALPRQAVTRNGHGNFGSAWTESNV